MRPLLNVAVFGLVPVPCAGVTFGGDRADLRPSDAWQIAGAQRVGGRISKRMASSAELAEIYLQLRLVEAERRLRPLTAT